MARFPNAWRLGALGLLLGATSGCAFFGQDFDLAWERPDPFASAWRSMEHRRITTVRGVEYDVNLRWFTGDERALMVHRVDKQPMFDVDFEIETAGTAIDQAYARDVCFGQPLQLERFEYETPGVWVGHGRCPAGATPIPTALAAATEARQPVATEAPQRQNGWLDGLFTPLGL